MANNITALRKYVKYRNPYFCIRKGQNLCWKHTVTTRKHNQLMQVASLEWYKLLVIPKIRVKELYDNFLLHSSIAALWQLQMCTTKKVVHRNATLDFQMTGFGLIWDLFARIPFRVVLNGKGVLEGWFFFKKWSVKGMSSLELLTTRRI